MFIKIQNELIDVNSIEAVFIDQHDVNSVLINTKSKSQYVYQYNNKLEADAILRKISQKLGDEITILDISID